MLDQIRPHGLIDAFRRFRAAESRHIIFDGHIVVDAGETLVEIPYQVVQAIHPTAIIHLWDEPDAVARRRLLDVNRKRPARTSAELERHQRRSDDLARDYSERLGVPFFRIQSGQHEQFAECMLGTEFGVKDRRRAE